MKILIGCPKGIRTGGPEALHQLSSELKRNGVEVFLHDFSLTGRFRRSVREYKQYGVEWLPIILGNSFDLVITPESFPFIYRGMLRKPSSRFATWWLSVDNSIYFRGDSRIESHEVSIRNGWDIVQENAYSPLIVRAGKLLQKLEKALFLEWLDPRNSMNLCQSAYAAGFVADLHPGNSCHPLSDYILEPETTDDYKDALPAERLANTIAFNAAKGGRLVSQLEEHLPGVKFVPIRGMTRAQVCRTLRSAAFYLDMGHFPGKDRLPREAIRLGCPVILAKRGSARIQRDFPVPEEYLIDLLSVTPFQASSKIWALLSSDLDHAVSQEAFRQICLHDRETFANEVSELVKELKVRIEQ